MMGELLFYYVFCASAVFAYGVGLKQAVMKSSSLRYFCIIGVKTVFTVFASLVPVWFLTQGVLVHYGVAELFPIVLIVVVLLFSGLIDLAFHAVLHQVSTGILLPTMILFLAVNESTSFSECLIVSAAITFSIFAFMPFLYAIRKRLATTTPPRDFKISSVVFFSSALLFLALFACNMSWLTQGGR